jgi:cupin fold WbuC family metalloprotein
MKIIDKKTLQDLHSKALTSPRLRANHNLHPVNEDPIQRFCNAIEPGSYVRPHRHSGEGRWELFLCLTGAVAALIFDEDGVITGRTEVRAGGPVMGIEIPEGTWHTVTALEPGTSIIEIKRGPYKPVTAGDFAPWSPPDGDAACAAAEEWFRNAQPGMRLEQARVRA